MKLRPIWYWHLSSRPTLRSSSKQPNLGSLTFSVSIKLAMEWALSMKTYLFPCHNGYLEAMSIGFRRWRSIDISWPKTLYSGDVEERLRSWRDWVLTAEHRHLSPRWHSLDLGWSKYCGRCYLKVLQQLFDLNKSSCVGAEPEAAAPVRAWRSSSTHVRSLGLWCVSGNAGCMVNPWLPAAQARSAASFINQNNTWLWKWLMLNKFWLCLLDNFSPMHLNS